MLLAYRHRGRDAAKAALLQRAVAGVDAARLAAAGEAYGAVLAGRIRPGMATRLQWHREQGHRLILVSASLTDYLVPFARQAGGFDQVIATRLEVDGEGHLTGRLVGNNVRAEEKAIRLRAFLGDSDVELWAYGDSAGDRQMLAMADHPYQVGGSRLSRHRPLFRATPLTGWHRAWPVDRPD
jgi:phosphatidylglycerophosphatase C